VVSLVIHSLLVIYPQVFHHFCTERAAFLSKITFMSSCVPLRFQSHFSQRRLLENQPHLAGVIHISTGPITTATHIHLFMIDGYNSSRGCGNVDNCHDAITSAQPQKSEVLQKCNPALLRLLPRIGWGDPGWAAWPRSQGGRAAVLPPCPEVILRYLLVAGDRRTRMKPCSPEARLSRQ
jgi:hypothetical protein